MEITYTYCCNDLREFFAYLEAVNRKAGPVASGSEKSKEFKLCPFCGKKLEIVRKVLDPTKQYEIKWDDELNTGVPWIDSQHKKLLDRMNALLNAIIHGDHYDETGKAIKFLQTYVQAHFGTEEGLMQKQYFPGYEVQKKQHAYFIKRIEEFSKTLEESGPSEEISLKLAGELWRWFKGNMKITLYVNVAEFTRSMW